jgi:signal transduction histidine kinase
MTKRILRATALVVVITLAVGLLTAAIIRSRVQESASDELSRQARVTATLIEEDLEGIQLRPGGDVASQLARYRNALDRSLERARILGGHDVVEAVLTFRGRDIPISEPQVVLPDLPDRTREGEVVTVDVGGKPMLVAVERLHLNTGTLSVAVGRAEELFPAKQVFWSLLFALIVGAVLTVALGVWFSQSLSARLDNIGRTARRVGEGELSARADDLGDDEISEVAGAFDAMAGDLQAARDREREFLMAVGHDLRTPLTTIRGYAEALDEGEVPAERLPEVAAALHRQTDQLSRLIEDVSLLARIEASEFTLRREPVEVVGLVGEAVHSYDRRLDAVSISLVLSDEGPQTATLDPDRVRQVIGNLMDNALRYTPEGGTITVHIAGDRSRVRISVANTGPRIRQVDVPHVFERLYVADRYRAERPAGSGLGLAIVDQLVSAMDGSVTCAPDSVSGTVFIIELGREP